MSRPGGPIEAEQWMAQLDQAVSVEFQGPRHLQSRVVGLKKVEQAARSAPLECVAHALDLPRDRLAFGEVGLGGLDPGDGGPCRRDLFGGGRLRPQLSRPVVEELSLEPATGGRGGRSGPGTVGAAVLFSARSRDLGVQTLHPTAEPLHLGTREDGIQRGEDLTGPDLFAFPGRRPSYDGRVERLDRGQCA